jgi:chemotaxis protein MotC
VRSAAGPRGTMAALAAAVALAGLAMIAGATGALTAENSDAAPAEAGPVGLVRSLQILQEQIANGNVAAHAAQSALLERIEARFTQAPPDTWQDPRNARAAVVYLLSGGKPAMIRTLLSYDKPPAIEDRLIKGALAYVEGHEDEARDLLRPVDVRSLPPSLGGPVALVQSALIVRQDVAGAMAFLDEARLLMPGTLVEEAALRREIFLAGQVDNADKFEALAIQYVRRFRHSIYAGNFREHLAVALTRFSFAQNTNMFSRVQRILEHLDPASRRSLYLMVARTAVLRGKTDMARLAAEQAAAASRDGSPDGDRARLYRAITSVLGESYEDGMRDLARIDRKRLSVRDAELLDATQRLAGQVRKWPDGAAPGQRTIASAEPAPPIARIDTASAAGKTINHAQKLLEDVDKMLKEADR